ncbi:MAG: ABC transporter permease, partial [Firmicutes bacterium]|nr:ABC transporter permease [Bacillota bacterium]
NYIYVSPETYLAQVGTTLEFKTLFLLGNEGADPYEESVRLSESDDVGSVTVNDSSRERISDMLSRLNILIVVVVACAGALAFIVLFNLTNINITERIREIATIKVLGFYENETAKYVFREITMLSAGGSFVGLFMGKALHAFVMAQVQVDNMFFPVQIQPVSYLASVILTMFFSWLITRFMKPRLDKIDMAESLKSIE